MKILSLLAITTALVACGDNKQRPDAMSRRDGASIDAQCSNCPPAPALGGTILDRMGRPAINTALNHAFDPDATASTAAKDMYNADSNYAAWQTTWAAEIAKNLAILDVLDGGICGNGLCEQGEIAAVGTGQCTEDCTQNLQIGSGLGCGNQLMYVTPLSTTSYGQLAGLLANDVLYLDTSKGQCSAYLAIELGVVRDIEHSTCGGRAPDYDVIDYTYSALALGINGFSTDSLFTPQFGDLVPKHTDYLSTFPYLGEPH